MHFDASLFTQYMIIGLASGALIALIALGYTLVYGIIELINFAHGEIFMLGSFCAVTVIAVSGITSKSTVGAIIGISIIAMIAAMIFSAALNFATDRIAYRRLRNAPRLAPLITAIGVSFCLQNVGIYWKGSIPISPPDLIPFNFRTYNILTRVFHLHTTIRLRPLDVLVFVITIPLLIGMSWFVYRTRLGKAMRATAQDREAAALMGIDVNLTISMAFLLGGALAGAAGMIAAYYNNSVWYHMGFRYGLYAFTAAVLGGIGNLAGAVFGGLFIGIVWAMSDGFVQEYIPSWGAQWTPTAIFGVLVLVMVFRPTGLFGDTVTDKV